jgi:hypothetical protein
LLVVCCLVFVVWCLVLGACESGSTVNRWLMLLRKQTVRQ